MLAGKLPQIVEMRGVPVWGGAHRGTSLMCSAQCEKRAFGLGVACSCCMLTFDISDKAWCKPSWQVGRLCLSSSCNTSRGCTVSWTRRAGRAGRWVPAAYCVRAQEACKMEPARHSNTA